MSARILLIEDKLPNLELMTYLLQAFGYTALPAMDGAADCRSRTRERPDLIICDVQLPTIDGLEVARRLKDDPKLAHHSDCGGHRLRHGRRPGPRPGSRLRRLHCQADRSRNVRPTDRGVFAARPACHSPGARRDDPIHSDQTGHSAHGARCGQPPG